MDYILTWSNGFGKVSSGKYLFDINSAPALGFFLRPFITKHQQA